MSSEQAVTLKWDGYPPDEMTTAWHWLRDRRSKELAPWQWVWTEESDGPGYGDWQTDTDLTPEDMADLFDYVTLCAPPAEAL